MGLFSLLVQKACQSIGRGLEAFFAIPGSFFAWTSGSGRCLFPGAFHGTLKHFHGTFTAPGSNISSNRGINRGSAACAIVQLGMRAGTVTYEASRPSRRK